MTDILAISNSAEETIKEDTLASKLSANTALYQAEMIYENQDHFISENGVRFAGYHLILDFWGASKLDDLALMETALREAVTTAKATLLHIHLHHFTPNGGISGVAVLAESHISVHSWPEFGYAAFDVFMCGDAKPHKTIEVLREAFKPSEMKINEFKRGQQGAAS